MQNYIMSWIFKRGEKASDQAQVMPETADPAQMMPETADPA